MTELSIGASALLSEIEELNKQGYSLEKAKDILIGKYRSPALDMIAAERALKEKWAAWVKDGMVYLVKERGIYGKLVTLFTGKDCAPNVEDLEWDEFFLKDEPTFEYQLSKRSQSA